MLGVKIHFVVVSPALMFLINFLWFSYLACVKLWETHSPSNSEWKNSMEKKHNKKSIFLRENALLSLFHYPLTFFENFFFWFCVHHTPKHKNTARGWYRREKVLGWDALIYTRRLRSHAPFHKRAQCQMLSKSIYNRLLLFMRLLRVQCYG